MSTVVLSPHLVAAPRSRRRLLHIVESGYDNGDKLFTVTLTNAKLSDMGTFDARFNASSGGDDGEKTIFWLYKVAHVTRPVGN